MICDTKLTANIINDCTKRPVKGVYPTVWVLDGATNKCVFGLNNKIIFIDQVSPAQFFKIEALKFGINAGHEVVASEVKANGFKHKISLMLNVTDAELDKLENILIVGKKGDEYFVLGAQNGLWKTAQSRMANDNSGMVAVEFQSRADMEEDYSEYAFDTSMGLFKIMPISEYLESTMEYIAGESGKVITSDEYFTVVDGAVAARSKNYEIIENAILLYYNTIAGYTIS